MHTSNVQYALAGVLNGEGGGGASQNTRALQILVSRLWEIALFMYLNPQSS